MFINGEIFACDKMVLFDKCVCEVFLIINLFLFQENCINFCSTNDYIDRSRQIPFKTDRKQEQQHYRKQQQTIKHKMQSNLTICGHNKH